MYLTLQRMKTLGDSKYVYAWGNNPKRISMKNRLCKIIARGKMNSVMIEFMDNGQTELVSRRSLKRREYDSQT